MGTDKNAQGFTLVEMMIAAAIMGVVIYGISIFLKNSMQQSNRTQSRSSAQHLNKEIIDLVQRDFKFQVSFDVDPSGKSLTIKRKQNFRQGVAQSTYDVRFETQCVAVNTTSAGTNALVKQIYSGKNSQVIQSSASKCIASLLCAPGLMPQVVLTVTGAGPDVPVYSHSKYPLLTGSVEELSKQSVGSALCFYPVNSKVRMVIESLAIFDNKQATVILQDSEILLSASATTNVNILPGR